MAVLEQIISGLEKGKQEYSRIMERIAGNSTPEETSIHKQELRQESVLSLSDNLAFMERLMTDGYGGKFRTIYIDPPFFTKSKFNAAVSVRGADGTKHRIRHLRLFGMNRAGSSHTSEARKC